MGLKLFLTGVLIIGLFFLIINFVFGCFNEHPPEWAQTIMMIWFFGGVGVAFFGAFMAIWGF